MDACYPRREQLLGWSDRHLREAFFTPYVACHMTKLHPVAHAHLGDLPFTVELRGTQTYPHLHWRTENPKHRSEGIPCTAEVLLTGVLFSSLLIWNTICCTAPGLSCVQLSATVPLNDKFHSFDDMRDRSVPVACSVMVLHECVIYPENTGWDQEAVQPWQHHFATHTHTHTYLGEIPNWNICAMKRS